MKAAQPHIDAMDKTFIRSTAFVVGGAFLLTHGLHICPNPSGFECQPHLAGEMPAPTSAAAVFQVTLAST